MNNKYKYKMNKQSDASKETHKYSNEVALCCVYFIIHFAFGLVNK